MLCFANLVFFCKATAERISFLFEFCSRLTYSEVCTSKKKIVFMMKVFNRVSEYFSNAERVRNGRRIQFETSVKLSSKPASNRV